MNKLYWSLQQWSRLLTVVAVMLTTSLFGALPASAAPDDYQAGIAPLSLDGTTYPLTGTADFDATTAGPVPPTGTFDTDRGTDESDTNDVVRVADTTSYGWSISLDSAAGIAINTDNVIAEMVITADPDADIVITLPNSLAECPGGFSINEFTPNVYTVRCDTGTWTSIATRSFLVDVTALQTSIDGSSYSTTQSVYKSNDPLDTEFMTIDDQVTGGEHVWAGGDQNPVYITSKPPEWDIQKQRLYFNQTGFQTRDTDGDGIPERGYQWSYLIDLRTQESVFEALVMPAVVIDDITLQAADGTTHDTEFLVTRCRDFWQPIGPCSVARIDGSPTGELSNVALELSLGNDQAYDSLSGPDADGWYTAGTWMLSIWVPESEVLWLLENSGDGVADVDETVQVVNQLFDFDPDGISGENNYADGTEPGACEYGVDGVGECDPEADGSPSSNEFYGDQRYTAWAPSFQGPTGNKRYQPSVHNRAFPLYWPTTYDGYPPISPGGIYATYMEFRQQEVLPLPDLHVCDIFDNTTQRLGYLADHGGSYNDGFADGHTYLNGIGSSSDANVVAYYGHIPLTGDDARVAGEVPTDANPGTWDAQFAARCSDGDPATDTDDPRSVGEGVVGTTPTVNGWHTDPNLVSDGTNTGIDAVNAVYIMYNDPSLSVDTGRWYINIAMEARTTFYGGPNDGEPLEGGDVLVNYGSYWSPVWYDVMIADDPTADPLDSWHASTDDTPMPTRSGGLLDRLRIVPVQVDIIKDSVENLDWDGDGTDDILSGEAIRDGSGLGPAGVALAGDTVAWRLRPYVWSGTGADVTSLVISDVLTEHQTLNLACTVGLNGPDIPVPTVQYDTPVVGQTTVTFDFGTVTSLEGFLRNADTLFAEFYLCVDTSPIAPPSTEIRNTAYINADGSTENDDARILLSQPSELRIFKTVDNTFDELDDAQVHTLHVSNFSSVVPIETPTLIDVFPFVGDGALTEVARDPASDFAGDYVIASDPVLYWGDGSPVAAGDYELYYTFDDPAGIDQNPVTDANTWCLANVDPNCAVIDEPTAFKIVMLVDMAVSPNLTSAFTVDVTFQATGNTAGDLYTNRFTANSPTNTTLILVSNNVTVRVAGFDVGGRLWIDSDDSGTYDALVDFDVPDGVTVNLYQADGTFLASTTTVGGTYNFVDLTSGDYYVEIPASEFQPGGSLELVSPQTVGFQADPNTDLDDDTDHHASTTGTPPTDGIVSGTFTLSYTAFTTAATGHEPLGDNTEGFATNKTDDFTNYTIDFGLVAPASLGNFVWIDADADGIQDVGELGVADVTVTLDPNTPLDPSDDLTTVTDADGFYLFSGLEPGDYTITFDDTTFPAGYVITATDVGADDAVDSDGLSVSTTLSSGEIDLTFDLGLYVPASLGDFVWLDTNADGVQDAGEVGVEGVTVTLTDAAGNVVATTVTDADGAYSFTNLVPGDYTVTFSDLPADHVVTTTDAGVDDAVDSDGLSVSTTLVSGENDPSFDLGLYVPASLGDFVWLDADADGVQDAGEVGVGGVTVTLTDAAGNVVATTVTAADGSYSFTNLVPGDYTVTFSDLPADHVVTTTDAGVDDTVDSDGLSVSTTLVSGENDPSFDLGLYVPASLGDFVWLDTDADGVQDAGELGVGGVTVTLTDAAGNVVATTVTDADGAYSFTNLVPGDYTVTFDDTTLPAGVLLSPENVGGVATDSDGLVTSVTLASGENNTTIDLGVYTVASIGDTVWLDTDADGIQDVGEAGIAGVTVTLTDAAGDPVNDADGNLVTSVVTDVDGNYLFTNLVAGTYMVTFSDLPADHVVTTTDAGVDDAVDSDGLTPVTTVAGGESDLTLDLGLFVPASLGDFVWLDTDADGVQDAGEVGVGGVTVTLIDAAGNVVATTVTAADGAYSFTNLVPGDYTVTFSDLPADHVVTTTDAGVDDTVDSDGLSVSTTLVSGENDPSFDLGLYVPASLGDFVWLDTDADGVQDAGELGVEGVTVTLTDAAGNVVATTVTDADGAYSFTNLVPGDYTVTFDDTTLPAGVLLSPENVGGVATDSDGLVTSVTLASGENNTTIDLGVYTVASIGDTVWLDTDADGIQDVGELGVAGVTVTLTDAAGDPVNDADGNLVTSVVTDVDGNYLFTNLVPGTYMVTFSDLPADHVVTTTDAGLDDAVDSDGLTPVTTVAGGESDLTLDLGLYVPASLGDFVWLDTNADGVQDAGEVGVEGVTVTLTDAAGNVVATTVTAADGSYSFTNLVPGDYTVTFSDLPADHVVTTTDAGVDDTVDSDGLSVSTTLVSGENDPSFDLGLYVPASLGDFVWLDTDADGVQDAGEVGVEGVTVTLTDAAGNVVATTVTAADGSYSFTNLVPGDYTVTFSDLPADHVVTTTDAGVDDTVDSDGLSVSTTLVSGENDPSFDLGLYVPASLGDFVWLDTNADGVQDAGEVGVEGVTVTLTDAAGNVVATTVTDADGAYSFTNLVPGDYTVTFSDLPADHVVTTTDAGVDDAVDSDGLSVSTTLVSGENDPSFDLGLYVPASLGDFVWLDADADGVQDAGEVGVGGVTVTLTDAAGNVVATTVTAADGSYSFTNLVPGDYTVTFSDLPADHVVTTTDAGVDDTVDSDGLSVSTTLVSGENDPSFDLGLYVPASLGDFVWLDTNADGVQDAGEVGVEGVTVTLIDAAGNVVATTVTAADGAYSFTNLVPGDYTVTFSDLPADHVVTTTDVGVDDTVDSDGLSVSTTLVSGENDPSFDLGLYVPASLGDFVWLDADADGVQDAGELGVEGVTVTLTDAAGNVVATTVTAADGAYSFTNLVPGDYTVTFDDTTLPAGVLLSPENVGGVATDSDGLVTSVTLASGENNTTIDLGVYTVASIGDTVWLDTNADGIQDVGELGVAGVTVTLTDAAGDPVNDADGNLVTSVVTDVDGNYLFTNLVPGTYMVTFSDLPADHVVTTTDAGLDDAVDSDGLTPVTTVAGGESDLTLDLGLYVPASLGDFVWLDTNADGVQDAGEVGVEGVTVTLTDAAGNVVATTVTAADGSYSFTNLVPGDYTVTFSDLPADHVVTTTDAGVDDTVDSDGLSVSTTLVSGENDPSFDLGLYVPASLGDFVWLDTNADGVQDAGEVGVEGVTVTLTDAAGNVVATTVTAADGAYSFTNLVPGDYTVTFSDLPADHVVTTTDAGVDDTVDSDGLSVSTTLVSGENDPSFDLGLYVPASLGDFVWLDTNADGVQDAGEVGVEGVTVTLTDAAGNVVATTVTDADGAYSFTNLVPGDYTVTFDDTTLPAGVLLSPENVGGVATDSDGLVTSVTLASGENNTTIDLGVYTVASIGDTVWLDTNADGIQDVGELGVAGVTVTLTDAAGDPVNDADGNLVTSVVTDVDGNYLFTNLVPGTYMVTFSDLPADHVVTTTDAGLDDAVDSDGLTPVTTVAGGESDLTLDLGLYVPASLGDFVWLDTDADGVQDAGEVGVEGVTVTLTDAAGNVVATTVTAADGSYSFTNLVPGDYTVTFSDLPADHVVTTTDAGVDDTVDSDGLSVSTTLVSGENDPSFDLGLYVPASLGDFVWLDADADGVQDAGEVGVGGVTVTLTDAAGNVVATTVTAADGSYSFTNLVPGDYTVTFSDLPADHVVTTTDAGVDDTVDSDGLSVSTTLVSGENDPSFDLGLYVPASLGDFVWLDTDADGVQDAGELGVEGVTVTLTDAAGNVVATTVTDADGAYSFTNLVPGDYTVTFDDTTLPAGVLLSPENVGGVATDSDGLVTSVTLASGENNTTIDLGVYTVASIGDTVWLDTNADGIQDVGELGVAGVTVTLTDAAGDPVNDADGNLVTSVVTDVDGNYLFTNLVAGTYMVTFSDLPADHVVTTTDAGLDDAVDSDGLTPVTTVAGGESDLTLDLGLYVPASLGDFVWLDTDADGVQDAGEVGVEGVTVTLTDAAGNVVATTVTAADGSYSFTNLVPGDYTVTFSDLPADHVVTTTDAGVDDTVDSDGLSVSTTLVSGENDPSFDLGLFVPASLGDFVWLDADADGVQDVGELGVGGVTVTLTDAAGDPVVDADGNPVGATTTAADGSYSFTNLVPGDYIVTFDDTTLPVGAELSPENVGGVATDSDGLVTAVTLASGENDTTIDLGIYTVASIGDFVWLDTDADGIQDAGELGVGGVTVTLTYANGNPVFDADGNPVTSVVTDVDGNYLFTNLVPGTYMVTFSDLPVDHQVTTTDVGGDDTVDSDGLTPVTTVAGGESDLTLDLGLFVPASLGDFVWLDADADGVQDVGELGVGGVTVTLTDAAGDPVVDADGNPVAATTTAADGSYSFTNLVPGDYTVTFSDLPVDHQATTTDAGGDDTVDSDGLVASATLASGESDLTLDLGLFVPASLGDFVWLDADADGVQDVGELGVGGVTVTLTDAAGDPVVDADGNPVAATTTAADGSYSFTNLVPGDYTVTFSDLPVDHVVTTTDAGGDDTVDSDGLSVSTTLVSGENDPSFDLGLFVPASLGDFVWLDADADGVQDVGELGVGGVTVTLTDAAGDPVVDADGNPVGATTTAADGSYSFTNLVPGDYIVTFDDTTLPVGAELSPENVGGVATDSDGLVTAVTLASGENDTTIDLGIYTVASIGDMVWLDTDADGIQDAGELGVGGVTVTLTYANGNPVFDADGNPVTSVVTDVDGNYLFTNLVPGTYMVTFSDLPVDHQVTTTDVGGDDTVDSDGLTPVTTVAGGESDLTLDLGLFVPASLGDFVWLDADADGVQDVGELGVGGVTVTLTDAAGDPVVDADGNPVAATTTAADGSYSFTNLVPGDYTVTFSDLPVDHVVTTTDVGGDDTVDSDGLSVSTTLVSGENDPSFDLGLFVPASLGDFVWLDTNADGVQDAGELGVEGVTVTLTDAAGDPVVDADGNPVAATTTAADGSYSFTNLVPGDYTVTFSDLPADHVVTTTDVGVDDTVDSDGLSVSTTLVSGENDPSFDLGLFVPASLGDFVWLDADADGVQDVGELGVGGVTVTLTDAAGDPVVDADGNPVGATTTAADGSYSFTNLVPGDYIVTFDDTTLPVGAELSPENVGGVATDSDGLVTAVTLASGENDTTIDLGVFVPSSLGDFVWLDADADGVQDVGELGVGGVTVTLTDAAGDPVVDADGNPVAATTTAADGSYSFTNLVPGDYTVTFSDLPVDHVVTTTDVGGDDTVDSDGLVASATLASGESDLTLDLGLFVPASLGDFVWLDADADGVQDVGELGVGGVTVTLTDAAGDPVVDADGNPVAATTTAADGSYSFTNLVPGDYTVTFSDLPVDHVVTTTDVGVDDTVDSDGLSVSTTLVSGENDPSFDLGLFVPASLGDFVWLDADADGVQDVGELGVGGVTVTLTDAAGDPVVDADGNPVAATTTAADGSYSFTNLVPGDYTVTFSDLPVDHVVTTTDVGVDDTVDSDGLSVSTTLVSGENDPSFDLGLFVPASLGDFVWLDTNADGVQDAGELGVEGVTVTLTDAAGDPVVDADGNPVGATTTAADGSYSFTNLVPGDYIVTFDDTTLPVGAELSPENVGGVATDSDGLVTAVTLASGENDTTIDLGVFVPSSLGDFVWLDTDADGIQDAGELGVGGVTVTLTDAAGDPVTDADGNAIDPMLTDADGAYSFTNLVPGTYMVTFTQPVGMELSPSIQGGDTALDSNGLTTTVTLESGDDDPTIDLGLFVTASVGDFVWDDLNGDGIQDAGEPGIAGVTVTLTDAAGNSVTDADGNAIDPMLTDADGAYSFTNLVPGTYMVTFTQPVGMELSPSIQGGDTALDSNGLTTTVTLESGDDDPTIDLGLFATASVGDFVWDDLNGDGIQDAGEPGIAGVTVTLTDAAGNSVTDADGNAIDPMLTDADGAYSFTNLVPGTYMVTFTQPVGMELSPSIQGGDTALDSNGLTTTVTLESGDDDPTIDLGLFATASVGDFVWDDLNGDGIQDAGEPGIAGVTVTLTDAAGNSVTDADGNAIDPMLTDADGAYSFTNLVPGTYMVTFTQPVGMELSPSIQGGDTALDSNGLTTTVTLESGDDDPTIDLGLFVTASVGDFVWDDLNGDGIQDAGEPGIAGVTVTLTDAAGNSVTDADGNAIDPMLTDADGAYSFTNLVPGTYDVVFTQPVGMELSPSIQGGDTALDSNGLTTTVTLESGDDDPTIDLGAYDPFSSSIAGTVFVDHNNDGVQDPDEPGIEGVQITLTGTDDLGAPVTRVVLTDADGNYLFDSLRAGTYQVNEEQPASYLDGIDTVGTSGGTLAADETSAIELGVGVAATDYDFGELIPSSISGTVYEDWDVDGAYSAGDVGIEGVEVTLTGVDDLGNEVSVTVFTNAAGDYIFEDLRPGTYTVTETQPVTHVDASDTVGSVGGDGTVNDVTSAIELDAGVDAVDYDFGEARPSSIAGSVYDDMGNPIVGVEITLAGTDDLGNPVELTAFTDANGDYIFTDLRPGTYVLTEAQPLGYGDGADLPGSEGGDASTDDVIAAIELGVSVDAVDYDFIETTGSISGIVFHDYNNDGLHDSGEPLLANVEVVLTGTNDLGEEISMTTTTDADGAYLFNGLLSGNYTITETQPVAYLDGIDTAGSTGGDTIDDCPGLLQGDSPLANAVANDLCINDVISNVPLAGGEHSIENNFAELGNVITGTVWVDTDNDGVIDPEETIRLGGVEIMLLDEDGNVVATTTTNPDGTYAIGNVPAGNYTVLQTQPDGYASTTPNSLDISVPVGGLTDIDFGELPGAITGVVWEDANSNGVYDSGETLISGVEVILLDGNGVEVATTTTDATGAYLFDNLLAGDYTVRIVPPMERFLTTPNTGIDDTIDSDFAFATSTVDVTLTPGELIENIDAGLIVEEIDLRVSIATQSAGDQVGDPAVFVVGTGNSGNVPVDGLRVVIAVPEGLQITDVDAPQGWEISVVGNTVTGIWVGTLEPGEEPPMFLIHTLILRPGTFDVPATVSTLDGSTETTLMNNNDITSVTVAESDDDIPVTGTESGQMVRISIMLLLLGAFLTLISRRRNQHIA